MEYYQSENENKELIVLNNEYVGKVDDDREKYWKFKRILVIIITLSIISLLVLTMKNHKNTSYWIFAVNFLLLPFLGQLILIGKNKFNNKSSAAVCTVLFLLLMLVIGYDGLKQYHKQAIFKETKITVPNMKNWTVTKIKAWETKNNLNNVTIKFTVAPSIKNNRFVKFNKNIKQIGMNDKLIIYVAKNPKNLAKVTMINLKGKTLGESKKWLTENKLNVKIIYDENDDLQQDTIISQDKNEGESVVQSSVITLHVSKYKLIKVIDLSGYKVKDAAKWVSNNNLKYSLQYVETLNSSDDYLIKSNTYVNQVVRKDTVITLYVYRYKNSASQNGN